jgi:uncharacterized protein (TIGR03000 family)
MFQSSLWTLRIVALAATVVALTAEPVSAGILRGDRGLRGGRRGNYDSGNYGPGYGYGGYSGAPMAYGSGGYVGEAGYASLNSGNGMVLGPTADGSRSNYFIPANDRTATIDVRVPANAKVWFGDEATRQTGTMRRFASPALERNAVYTYTVKAMWEEDGKTVERTQTVEVRAGRVAVADFLRADASTPKTEEK